ncbi:hypothetical protein A2716_03375 [candidate division WWE3 bacterium RIFCSPHIGHO2_01_FULL_40_23]|uniref:Uncharacterized protein n=1 Tax=candidate division WWE3 bacterium RIFCSPLOWO2_01_FULL_41_18 TaxID=1802625 RepID=A0A1F4VCE1_UNCKA|nr:MAG: hypothetical protein A2716_03375 [candidate division WWE3 bacterium RIFCSPHIGHO2_01_FULL_40_23]OGC54921.1 MAG: hypothetical protein A3A78_02985 [candidate division WWE3 bacterium RIFCSPLOWO2_01_FULL_41_18]
MKFLFEEIANIEYLNLEFSKLEIEETELDHLNHLAKSIIHHKTLDLILDELPDDCREEFLVILSEDEDHQTVLDYLKKSIKDFEVKLIEKVKEIELELMAEIKGEGTA